MKISSIIALLLSCSCAMAQLSIVSPTTSEEASRAWNDQEWLHRANRFETIELHDFTTSMLTAIGGSGSSSVTTGSVDAPAWVYRPSSTADGAANYQALLGPYSNLAVGVFRSTLNWSKRKVLSVRFQYPAATAGTIRYYWGPRVSEWAGGDLAVKGIGFEISNGTLFAVCHNGSAKNTAAHGVSLTAGYNHNVLVDSDGAGTVRWWVNGVEQAKLSGGPTDNSALGAYGFCTAAENPTPAAGTFVAIQRLFLASEL